MPRSALERLAGSIRRPRRRRPRSAEPPRCVPWARRSAGYGVAAIGFVLVAAPAARGRDRQYDRLPGGMGDRGRLAAHARRFVAALPERSLHSSRKFPAHGRAAQHRIEDRGPLRRRVRARLPNPRPAHRAGAQARQGDGRPPERLGLARVRPERVHGLPLARRPAAVRRLRGGSLVEELRSTWPSTHAASATRSSHRPASSSRPTTTSRSASSGSRRGSSQPRATPRTRRPPPDLPVEQPAHTMIYRTPGPGDEEPEAPAPEPVQGGRDAHDRGAHARVTQPSVVLGRSREADVRIADVNVSRRHAELRQEGATLLDRRSRLDERDARSTASARIGRACATATASRSARRRSCSAARSVVMPALVALETDETLLILKIAFLVLLYGFIVLVVRSATKGMDQAPRRASSWEPPRPPPCARSMGPRPPRLARRREPRAAGRRDHRAVGPIVVGRDAQSGIRLDRDEFVSARHARIEPRANGAWVDDLGSTNGTFVNGLEAQEGPRSRRSAT